MAVNYTEIMQGGPPEDLAAAKAPVISFERVKPKRLTKKTKRVLLRERTKRTEIKTMAKKKRTAKQEAATRKLIAYNRRRARGGRKTVRTSGRRATAAAVVSAREPSTAMVVYGRPKPAASKPPKKPRKKTGKSGTRSSTRKTSGTTRKTTRKTTRRSAAPHRSGRRRAKAVIVVSAGERRRRRSPRRRRGAMENPLTGVELFIGTLTGLMGFGTADVVDRILATHALTSVTAGTTTAYTDVPPTTNPAQGTKATYGSLFNATAVCAPMNVTRWLSGLAISGVPILIGHFVSAPVGRSALQFFGFGALMRVAGKGLIDMVAALTKSNATGMRLYSGEQRAAALYNNDGSVSSLPANALTGLGRPQLGAPTLQMHKAGCGCGNCKTGTGYPSMPAANNPNPVLTPPPVVSTPVVQTPPATVSVPVPNVGIQGIPMSTVGFRPSPGMYRWGEKAA
jgi:hypothetical protein